MQGRPVSSIFFSQLNCRDMFLMNQEFEDEADVPSSAPHWEQFSTYLKKSLSAARGLKPLRCHLTEEKNDLRTNRVFNKEFLTDYLKNNKKFLEMMRDRIENNTPIQPSYLEAHVLLQKAASHLNITDKMILIIGTSQPWIEALLMTQSPRHVTTVDYNTFESDLPNWTVMTPSTFRRRYLNGTLDKFDFIFTFSSVEHSGLGRYGDSINPWADILTIAESHCASTDDAKLVIGVPTVHQKYGAVVFNANRIYGEHNYPYLVQNWKFFWQPKYNNKGNTDVNFEDYQPIYVFEKLEKF